MRKFGLTQKQVYKKKHYFEKMDSVAGAFCEFCEIFLYSSFAKYLREIASVFIIHIKSIF